MRTTLPILAVLALGFACNKVVDEDFDGFSEEVDCDDFDDTLHPGAAELCDGIDNDCDGEVDEHAIGGGVYFPDGDGDGYGTFGENIVSCEMPTGYASNASDCDDANVDVNPGAVEVCDDLDNDCNGLADDDPSDGTTYYADWDGDGYGSDTVTETSCAQPDGYIEVGGDCNDFDVLANPDQVEVCDWIDNDCDGTADEPDEAIGVEDFWVDEDGDGYGNVDGLTVACFEPIGYTDNADDCDDTEADVNPGMEEICNDGLDNDCSGDAYGCGVSGNVRIDESHVLIEGENSSDYFGRVLSVAGDVDGDGYDDIIVGAYGHDPEGNSSGGKAYLIYGGDLDAELDAGDQAAFYGVRSSDYLGYNVSGAGDINGDGYADVIFGAYGQDTYYSSGGVGYLVYGSSTRESGENPATDVDAAFWGASTSDYIGYGLSSAGDVDGDGYDDFLLGGYYWESYRGVAYLVYGESTDFSGDYDLDDYPYWQGANTSDYMGHQYSMGSGDFNGDGYTDLALGTHGYDQPSSSSGAVWVINGSSTRHTASSTASAVADHAFGGVSASGDTYFGASVAGVGDMNGDGYEDLAAGGYYYDGAAYDAGGVWVFLGGTGWTPITLSTSADFSVDGVNSSDYLGRDVSAAGDVDDDGLDDLVAGASSYDHDGTSSSGGAFLFLGDTALSGAYSASDADAIVYGAGSSSYVGYGVGGDGDIDGDGIDDLVVGAYGHSSYTGAVGVFFGGGL